MLEIKNTRIEMKNAVGGLISILARAEEIPSDLDTISMRTFKNEKRIKTGEKYQNIKRL